MKSEIEHLKSIIDDLKQANQDLKYQLITKDTEHQLTIKENEPVAWALIKKDSVAVVPNGSINNPISRGYVPLYAHPVRELTDEKITEIYKSITGNFWESGYKDFARAIERELKGEK